jgi:hypothetical protein
LGWKECGTENVVAKWSYYPDTSLEELESTTQPLKAQQETSDRNFVTQTTSTRSNNNIDSTKSFVTLEATLQKFVPYDLVKKKHLQEFGFGSQVPPQYTNFSFHIK